MSLVFYALSTIFAIICTRWYIRRYKIIRCLSKYPGPTPLPIIGNAMEVSSRTELLRRLLNLTEKYGPVVKLSIGPTPSMLVIQDPKFLEFVLNSSKSLGKSSEYRYLYEWTGDGLLTNDGGARWAKYRKILTPAFHYNVLKNFIPVFTSVCNTLVEKLDTQVGNPSFDISQIMKLYSLDNTCLCAMGAAVNALQDPSCQFLEDVSTVCNILIQRTFNPLLKNDILFKLTNQYYKLKKSFKELNEVTLKVITQRKLIIPKNSGDQNMEDDIDEYGKKRRLAFLDLLLVAADKDFSITDQHIKEEVATFMFAGHETSQVALSFCLYCLANNPDIQEKVITELQDIFGNDQNRPVTLKDISEMRYIDAVLKETLRLYPPVSIIGRKMNDDVTYNGHIIPKGITLLAFVYGLHRDPKLYPNPLKFDPERFFTGGEPKNPYEYLAFSAGKRDCIGKKFAMIEIKLTLATLLRRFELFPSNPQKELQVINEVVLSSLTGVHIQLRRRKQF